MRIEDVRGSILLGLRPSPWEPIQSVHLLNRMAWTLAHGDLELRMREVEALVGREAAAALFPRNSPIQEPIVPNGRREARVDVATLPAPRMLDTREANVLGMLDALRARIQLAGGTSDDPGDALKQQLGGGAASAARWSGAARR